MQFVLAMVIDLPWLYIYVSEDKPAREYKVRRMSFSLKIIDFIHMNA